MRHVKPMSRYPLMAVSKFLHFFNPSLFPIYDGAVMENQVVFGRFDGDYRRFCGDAGLDYNCSGEAFYPNYLHWARSLVRAAARSFMPTFLRWLKEELSPEHYKLLSRNEMMTLYATAFEVTAIGATKASRKS